MNQSLEWAITRIASLEHTIKLMSDCIEMARLSLDEGLERCVKFALPVEQIEEAQERLEMALDRINNKHA